MDTRQEEPRRITVSTRLDADQARREARRLAARVGFARADAEAVALAVSELAMNLHRYAPGGEIELRVVGTVQRRGLEVHSRDHGPGISDPDLAMQDGYTTSGGMGSGLPAVRRLMHEFTLETSAHGTTIVATKWLTRQP